MIAMLFFKDVMCSALLPCISNGLYAKGAIDKVLFRGLGGFNFCYGIGIYRVICLQIDLEWLNFFLGERGLLCKLVVAAGITLSAFSGRSLWK